MGNENSLELKSLNDIERIRDRLYSFYTNDDSKDLPFISEVINLYYKRFVHTDTDVSFREKTRLLGNALNLLQRKYNSCVGIGIGTNVLMNGFILNGLAVITK